jgi:hypothetical protein
MKMNRKELEQEYRDGGLPCEESIFTLNLALNRHLNTYHYRAPAPPQLRNVVVILIKEEELPTLS